MALTSACCLFTAMVSSSRLPPSFLYWLLSSVPWAQHLCAAPSTDQAAHYSDRDAQLGENTDAEPLIGGSPRIRQPGGNYWRVSTLYSLPLSSQSRFPCFLVRSYFLFAWCASDKRSASTPSTVCVPLTPSLLRGMQRSLRQEPEISTSLNKKKLSSKIFIIIESLIIRHYWALQWHEAAVLWQSSTCPIVADALFQASISAAKEFLVLRTTKGGL